jgi:hypothetical protein
MLQVAICVNARVVDDDNFFKFGNQSPEFFSFSNIVPRNQRVDEGSGTAVVGEGRVSAEGPRPSEVAALPSRSGASRRFVSLPPSLAAAYLMRFRICGGCEGTTAVSGAAELLLRSSPSEEDDEDENRSDFFCLLPPRLLSRCDCFDFVER